MFGAEGQPAFLVVLQAVARAFHLDHSVAALGRPELDQVGHAGAVLADIGQQAAKPGAQVRRWQADQRLFQALGVEQLPEYEG